MLIDSSLSYSKTLQFSLKAAERKKAGQEIISLGLGEPEFDTPEHIKQAAKDALDAGMTRYGAPQGLPELRELVAKKLVEENSVKATSDKVLITPGAKNALFLACAAVLRPGDEVINLTPCYVSNVPILKLAEPKAIIHNVPAVPEEFRIDWDKVRSLVGPKTRLIFINSPNNPTGTMLGDADVEIIRELVRENDLYVLSDEIYERIVFGSQKHISPGAFSDVEQRILTVGGFSKAYSMTGWRIGYVHAFGDMISLMTKIHQQLNSNTATFIQKAAVAALSGPQEHLADFLNNLKVRKKLYSEFLQGNEHLTGSDPQGGFFAFINITKSGMGSDEFATSLLDKTGVAVIPGISFGEHFDSHCRVSLVNHTQQVEEGLARISDFMAQTVKN